METKMKFDKYPKYKDSGVEWLGEIPEGWDAKPIRAIFQERRKKNEGPITDFILSVTKDRGVIPYDEKGAIGNNKSEDIERYKVVYPNDLVINKMNVVIGSLGLSKYHGALSQVYIVLKPKSSEFNINFLTYIFLNSVFFKSLIQYCKGIMELRESLDLNEFKKINLPIPKIEEQIAIANFLDNKGAKIDAAVKQKEDLIKLLKEQKQITIQNAVTKGIEPNRKMKDSGVEWIGEIPEEWEVKKFKYILRTKARQGWKGLKAHEYVDKSGYGFLSTPNIKTKKINYGKAYFITKYRYEESPEIMLEYNDILLVKDGSTLGISNVVKKMPFKCTVNSSIAVLRVLNKNQLLSDYSDYFMKSYSFQKKIELIKGGMGVPHLFQSDINNLYHILPKKNEQEKIVEYIEIQSSKIDNSIKLQEKQIEKLKEYKETLIDSVVTGKVRV